MKTEVSSCPSSRKPQTSDQGTWYRGWQINKQSHEMNDSMNGRMNEWDKDSTGLWTIPSGVQLFPSQITCQRHRPNSVLLLSQFRAFFFFNSIHRKMSQLLNRASTSPQCAFTSCQSSVMDTFPKTASTCQLCWPPEHSLVFLSSWI